VLSRSDIKRLKQYITLNRINNYGLQQFNSVTCGIPGGKISNSQHIQELEQLLQTYTPRLLVINIGGNDLDQVERNISKYIFLLRWLRKSKCYVFTMSIMLHEINKFNELSRISVKTQFNVNNKQDLHLTE
jgi:lysophospholipase L1-like esterase